MYYKFAKIVNLFKQNIFHKQNPPSNVKVQFSIIYHSTTAQMIQDGVADLHCRSDHYLAEEIYREYTDVL